MPSGRLTAPSEGSSMVADFPIIRRISGGIYAIVPNSRAYIIVGEVDAVHIHVERHGWGGGRPSVECCAPLLRAIPSMQFWRGRSPRAANVHTNDRLEGNEGMTVKRVVLGLYQESSWLSTKGLHTHITNSSPPAHPRCCPRAHWRV